MWCTFFFTMFINLIYESVTNRVLCELPMYATKNNEHNHYCQEFLDQINFNNWDIFKTQNGEEKYRLLNSLNNVKTTEKTKS